MGRSSSSDPECQEAQAEDKDLDVVHTLALEMEFEDDNSRDEYFPPLSEGNILDKRVHSTVSFDFLVLKINTLKASKKYSICV